MQGVYNYGSALQTYATVTALEKLGHDVEIVDYYPARMRNYGSLKQLYRDALPFHPKWKCFVIAVVKYPSMDSLKKVFRPFREKFFNMTIKYESNEELIDNPPVADCYCTGSDQVWNDFLDGGFDKAYFLNFAPQGLKKIALAASFGRDDISQDELSPVKNLLEQYDAISVREESGLSILGNINVPLKECILDPTFLLKADEWKSLAEPIKEKDYILVYQLHEDSITADAAIAIGNISGKKVIRISTDRLKRIKEGKTVFFPTIGEFISYIKNADLVVTDSFHATAFSIMFGTQFVSISWKMFNDRIKTILRKTGLENRFASTVNSALIVAAQDADFSQAFALLERERDKVNHYINEALQAGDI